jgi:hypothetical protein
LRFATTLLWRAAFGIAGWTMTIDGMVHIMPECRGMMGHYNLDRGWVEGSRPMMRLCTFGAWKVDKLVDVAHDGHLWR